MSTLELGLNYDISNEDYHADREYLSSSTLKLMNKCPREFYKKYVKEVKEDEKEEEERKPSTALTLGSYVHSIILEPHLVQKEYAIYNGGRKAGKDWIEFRDAPDNAGKTILNASQAAQGDLMKETYLENKHATSLISSGHAEQTLCVELEGVKIKVRADYIQGDKVVDVKTTASGITYDEVQETIIHWDYALSAALYVDAFSQHFGVPHSFYFIFLGKSPFGCEVYKASESLLENGRKRYKKALAKIRKARETGIWFNEGIQEISLKEGM